MFTIKANTKTRKNFKQKKVLQKLKIKTAQSHSMLEPIAGNSFCDDFEWKILQTFHISMYFFIYDSLSKLKKHAMLPVVLTGVQLI